MRPFSRKRDPLPLIDRRSFCVYFGQKSEDRVGVSISTKDLGWVTDLYAVAHETGRNLSDVALTLLRASYGRLSPADLLVQLRAKAQKDERSLAHVIRLALRPEVAKYAQEPWTLPFLDPARARKNGS